MSTPSSNQILKLKISLLDQAEQKYKASLGLDSAYYTSIANTGNVLRERAKIAKDKTIMESLFTEAITMYKSSLKINPSHCKGYIYWSQCLIEYSQCLNLCAENPHRVRALLLEAKEKCEASIEIKNNYHLACFTMMDICYLLEDNEEFNVWKLRCEDWTGSKEYFRHQRLSVRSSFGFVDQSTKLK